MTETLAEVLRRQGVSRRSFVKFCSLTAASLGLGPAVAERMAWALDNKPRVPVLWLHGLECTCCSESFIRSGHPLAGDVVLSMISLDYDDTIMASAGHQAEEILEQTRKEYKGKYVVAVEGNAPLAEDGVHCLVGGRPFVEQLREVASDAMAVIAWGSCASWGCVQAAKPNPTRATPVHQIIRDKPVIKVPGCPPIAEVMTAILAYIVTFDRLPDLDSKGRPKAFYAQKVHDKCYRRTHFDSGQFVEQWDDDGARRGYCLYKVGCRGPTTYNACSTVRWNGGVSWPVQSGHGCIGCSEEDFWDAGPFYERLAGLSGLNIDMNADAIGLRAVGLVAGGITVHAAVSAVKKAREAAAGEGPPPDNTDDDAEAEAEVREHRAEAKAAKEAKKEATKTEPAKKEEKKEPPKEEKKPAKKDENEEDGQ